VGRVWALGPDVQERKEVGGLKIDSVICGIGKRSIRLQAFWCRFVVALISTEYLIEYRKRTLHRLVPVSAARRMTLIPDSR
jgi:hypothetical protein